MGCMLTSDFNQLAAAIRPFRAIHHLRTAKIFNVTTRSPGQYNKIIQEKFGTEIKVIGLERMLDACDSVADRLAKAEAKRWIQGATAVVEPTEEEIIKSCKLALAFEKLLDEEAATVMTADCYGTMYRPLCQDYAFPCIGFTRLNNMGFGGICESDLQCGHDAHHLPGAQRTSWLHQRSYGGRVEWQHHPGTLFGHEEDGWPGWPCGTLQTPLHNGTSRGCGPSGQDAYRNEGNSGEARRP